jgi:hypothetical protein
MYERRKRALYLLSKLSLFFFSFTLNWNGGNELADCKTRAKIALYRVYLDLQPHQLMLRFCFIMKTSESISIPKLKRIDAKDTQFILTEKQCLERYFVNSNNSNNNSNKKKTRILLIYRRL